MKDNFSKHELDEIININGKYSKILFMFLNRWRTFNKAVFVEFDKSGLVLLNVLTKLLGWKD